jgi:hypothetical protein
MMMVYSFFMTDYLLQLMVYVLNICLTVNFVSVGFDAICASGA